VKGTINGIQGSYSRSELFEAGKPWYTTKEGKPRASEYDAIYVYVRHHAVQLSMARGRPATVMDAAEDLAEAKGICKAKSAGGLSLYQFMKECEKFRRELVNARKAARAAAAAAADSGHEEQEEEGVDAS